MPLKQDWAKNAAIKLGKKRQKDKWYLFRASTLFAFFIGEAKARKIPGFSFVIVSVSSEARGGLCPSDGDPPELQKKFVFIACFLS